MSWQTDLSDSEITTVIAAAAFAVKLLEEAESKDHKKTNNEGLETSLTKTRKEDNETGLPEPGRVSRQVSRKEESEDEQSPELVDQIISEGTSIHQNVPEKAACKVPNIKTDVSFAHDQRIPEGMTIDQKFPEKVAGRVQTIKKAASFDNDQRIPEGTTVDQKMPENTTGKVPSIKKKVSFADELNGTGSVELGIVVDTRPTVNCTLSTKGTEKHQWQSTAPGDATSKADAWEKNEMARLRKRYERKNSRIISWENEKKLKAKHQLDGIESELERRKARNLQHYRNEISIIDRIAGGARAVAEEKRRNAESKAKEKAKKIKSTGKIPVTCFCF